MKKYLKRFTTLSLAMLMLLSVVPPQVFANENHNYNYDDLTNEKSKYINGKPVNPAKTDNAKDLVKNPEQPEIYTLRNIFTVPVENNHKISYQPYIASVGAAAKDAEKAKVKKTIDMPKIDGFTPPDDKENFTIDYDTVKNGNKTTREFRYDEVNKTIQVNDVFQDINDFNRYVPGDGGKRAQTGSTGSALQVQALQDDRIKGFVPEKRYITVQLPSDTDNYVVEYRYNRNHYEVTFDTDGGTPVQARELFYGQKIPTLDANEVPTKDGYKLSGWTATPTLKNANGSPYTAGNLKSDLSGDLIMPAESVKFTAKWTPDSSARANNPNFSPDYNVSLDYGYGSIKTKKVNSEETFANPGNPRRDGYTFMGWQWIEKSKPSQTPVLYSFNNIVTSNINLKAIWVKNDRVDLDIYHYFLDKNGNKDESKYPNPLKETIYGKRVGNFSTTVGDQISDKWTLASPDEIRNSKSDEIKEAFEKYNAKHGIKEKDLNSFFQTIMVKEDNNNGDNEFYFFYRPFRQREYKVNYIDERFKGKESEQGAAIINQELVTNGNRHFDARNYRPIPGWKLTSDPQQQLFFDVDETTNAFKGINGTGKDEITFYYKDVRVIEVPENDPVPDGYVRVNFKADDGGSFGKDANGNDIKQLNYYVIKGLYSHLLPVPQELKAGQTKDADKYYITPDNGRSFKEWADSPLLNDNVIIEQNYTFTAKFDWSGLTAKGMVTTEAFKDANGNWVNKFAPTLEALKKQIVWMENGQEKALPADATVTFDGITSDDDVYGKLKELGKSDSEQVFRIVNFKAKVEFKDKKNTKELDLPVKVYKNLYEALTSGDKPLPLSEAEKNDLKDILKNNTENRYIKVTIKPNRDFTNKDNKVYYVNPNAWVEIPEVKADGSSTFMNWTADKDAQNENGKFDFAKRHKFTEDTIITPVGAKNVVEQEKGQEKPDVPKTYVKVIVKSTDNATTETAFERIFWVNPTEKVEINVDKPTGKKIDTDTTKYTLKFSKWQTEGNWKTEDKPKVWEDKIVEKFEKDTTILAKYSTEFQDIKVQKPTADVVDTPQGKVPTLDEIKAKIKAPEGKTVASVEYVTNGKPDVTKDDKAEAKVIVKYTDGSKFGSNDNPVIVPIEVHKNIIPSYDGNRPEGALKNYVKITFVAGTGGTITDMNKKAYYVSPEVEVDMTSIAEAIIKTPDTGYINDKWDKELIGIFENETVFTFKFIKTPDIVKVTDSSVQKPDKYAELIFQTDGHGKLDGDKDKITYYVNPKAGIKIVKLAKGQSAKDKEIAVPTPKANANYEFDNWYEELDLTNTIAADKTYVACFNLINVTLTYDAGTGQGEVPPSKTVKYGTKEVLANQEKLKKEHYTFLGWKLDKGDTNRIYKPGEDIVLTDNTKATAQWKIIQHKVSFNTMGGSDITIQEVDHGSTATKPQTNPTKAGFVFMGWKEESKESEEAYYNFNTPITEDKTLVAIWKVAVEKIGENDPVEAEYIKVKFEQGSHGTLEGDTLYKVGKDLSFEDAVKYGLVVPTIKPKEYYKAKAENAGWDKALVLDKNDITFTAQYEIEDSVIPIKPEKTDEQIKNEKPEGMVLVIFKVDSNRAYMVGPTKFYVKKSELVNIKAPLVVKTDLAYNFKGWNINTEDENNKVSFDVDTSIGEAAQGKPDIEVRTPRIGNNFIEIKELTDGATGYLTVIKGSDKYEFTDTTKDIKTRKGRKVNIETIKCFDLSTQNITIEEGDRIMYYATNGDLKSEIREIIVR